jgi:hypothetical protein
MATPDTAAPDAHAPQAAAGLGPVLYDLTARYGLAELRPRLAAQLGVQPSDLPLECSLVSELVGELIGHLPELAPVSRTEPSMQLRLFLASAGNALTREARVNRVMEELLHHASRDPVIARLVQPLETAWHGWLVDVIDAGIAAGELRPNLDPIATAWLIMTTIHGLRLFPLSAREHVHDVLGMLAGDLQSSPAREISHSR